MQSRRQRSRIEKLRLDSLRVPPAGKAQRAFREAKSDRIAAEFDINSFGIPAVCRVNGTNWVVDGQHRVSAIQKCGYAKASDTIECEVYEGLSIAEMARMFLGRNRSTPVTPFERFAVAVTAGYPTEVAITKIVESLFANVGSEIFDVAVQIVELPVYIGSDVVNSCPELVDSDGSEADDDGSDHRHRADDCPCILRHWLDCTPIAGCRGGPGAPCGR